MVVFYLKVGLRQRFPNWRAQEAPEELVRIQSHGRHPQILIQEVCERGAGEFEFPTSSAGAASL